MNHDLTIVIPAYNRGDVIHYTLESVRRARGGLDLEIVVVDDGSTPPLDPALVSALCPGVRVLAQSNQGLLFARLRGLEVATGRHVLFLDSDDLVSADKLTAQVAAMDAHGADVSYTDCAHTTLLGEYDALTITVDPSLPTTADPADFFITVQPPPHSPIFRTEYLRGIVRAPLFGPSPLFNPVAEIWFYHNAAPRRARVIHVSGPRAVIGRHPGLRLTHAWERLAIASLAVMEAFARTCPDNTPEARRARQLVGEKTFRSWRQLPHGFSPEFNERELRLWSQLAGERMSPGLGGRWFRFLARILGPVAAARFLRRLTAGSYSGCRTIDDHTMAALLAGLPPP